MDIESAGAVAFYTAHGARPLNAYWYTWEEIGTLLTHDTISSASVARATGSPIPEPSMNPPPDDCPFCAIAARPALAVTLFEDPDIIAFLDRGAIRPGHTPIIARQHVPTFEALPPRILNKITALGQQLARRMKQVYHVDRVAFLFTGGDVPHVHAHVVPMHAKTDITSARYITTPPDVTWGNAHLRLDRESLLAARAELHFVADALP